ncbi:MAG: hypothetical protein HKO91_07205 [Desulfobacterales bacterium]|nr:hypothetical protein [Desulfobacterales bacterium]
MGLTTSRMDFFRKQPDKRGFATFILIDTVRHQSISAPPGFGIIERHIQVILTEKPVKAHDGGVDPCFVSGNIKGFDTGFDQGVSFDGLLIEASLGAALLIPSFIADRY